MSGLCKISQQFESCDISINRGPDVVKILDSSNGKCKVNVEKIPDDNKNDSEKTLAIITSIGDFGVGKSFLSNVLLSFMQQGESSFADKEDLQCVFPTETSVRSETKGIDMCSEYFDRGDYIATIWDTEGPSDPTQSQDSVNTIFGLTVYFSSVVILNVKEKFTKSNMDQIQVFLHDVRESMSSSAEKFFQDLVIVIRDWQDEIIGYNWDGGKRYLDYMMSNECTDGQTQGFFKELQHSFRSVLVFLMPIPNHEVMKKPCLITKMKDLQEPFRSSLRYLAMQIFYDLLEPRKIDEEPLTVGRLKTHLKRLQLVFTTRGSIRPQTLANALKENRIRKLMEESFLAYQQELLKKKSGWFAAEATAKEHEQLKQSFVDQFKQSIQSVHFSDRGMVDVFTEQLNDLMNQRYAACTNEAHPASKVLWMVGGILIGTASVAVIVILSRMAPASTKKLLLTVIPIVVPFLSRAINQIIQTGNPDMDKALVGIVTSLTSNRNFLQQAVSL